jgi:hypothetical protein
MSDTIVVTRTTDGYELRTSFGLVVEGVSIRDALSRLGKSWARYKTIQANEERERKHQEITLADVSTRLYNLLYYHPVVRRSEPRIVTVASALEIAPDPVLLLRHRNCGIKTTAEFIQLMQDRGVAHYGHNSSYKPLRDIALRQRLN